MKARALSIGLLLFTALLAIGPQVPGQGPTEKPKNLAEADFSLACFFAIPEEGTFFLAKEDPAVLYYVQHFLDRSAYAKIHWREGCCRITFQRQQCIVEGLYLKPCPEEAFFQFPGPLPIFRMRDFGGERGFDLFAPGAGMGMSAVGGPGVAKGTHMEGIVLDLGKPTEKNAFLVVEANGDSNKISLYDSPIGRGAHGLGRLRGTFEYKTAAQTSPSHREWDLDGDGLDEVVVLHREFRWNDLIILSRTPEHFKSLRKFANDISEFGEWPWEHTELFEAGHKQVIPMK